MQKEEEPLQRQKRVSLKSRGGVRNVSSFESWKEEILSFASPVFHLLHQLSLSSHLFLYFRFPLYSILNVRACECPDSFRSSFRIWILNVNQELRGRKRKDVHRCLTSIISFPSLPFSYFSPFPLPLSPFLQEPTSSWRERVSVAQNGMNRGRKCIHSF